MTNETPGRASSNISTHIETPSIETAGIDIAMLGKPLNILIVGVGGQGSILTAKLLATMAHARSYHVQTAETIGMAQRGGSVVSHVRIAPASHGQHLFAPLMAPGSADVILAFEPGEALRQLAYLAPTGRLMTATTPLTPAGADGTRYNPTMLIETLKAALLPFQTGQPMLDKEIGDTPHQNEQRDQQDQSASIRQLNDNAAQSLADAQRLFVVDDVTLLEAVGNRRCLNTALLACAVVAGLLPFSLDELRTAVAHTLKPRLVELNLHAIECAAGSLHPYATNPSA